MNTCNKCKHRVEYCWGEHDVFFEHLCSKLETSVQNPVTGAMMISRDCASMRKAGGPCGPSGRHFSLYEPKTYEETRHPWMVFLFGGPKTRTVTRDERIVNGRPPGYR